MKRSRNVSFFEPPSQPTRGMARFQLPEEVRERQARTREAAQQAMVGGLRPYIAAEMTAARLRLRDREMDYL